MLNELFVAEVDLRYVMGGLARDSHEPMPADSRAYVREAWQQVAAKTGAQFNWDFWEKCQPRRSTYPSCRAVLAAAAQKPSIGPAMFHRIQHAYYLQARNPSDATTLVELAAELHLDAPRFAEDLNSPAIEQRLQDDFILRRRLQATAFPSLVLAHGQRSRWIARGWQHSAEVEQQLRAALLSLDKTKNGLPQ